MDQIQKIKDELEKEKNKSLRDKVTDLKSKITKARKHRDDVILVDVSGSMAEMVNQEYRAIDIVQHVMENFEGANLWEFSGYDDCIKVPQVTTQPRGGTCMHHAFDTMHENNIKELILITDGQPDSENKALEAAKGLKLNIVYIGPKPVPPFLEKLAGRTGGSFTDVELIGRASKDSERELTNKIQLMLGDGK